MKRRYVAMISAVLCSAMILSACGNSKKTESIYTGDKTEVPAWQANLDAISPSAYADVDKLDLEPGTYISVIGRAGGTPYWDEVKKGVEQAATILIRVLDTAEMIRSRWYTMPRMRMIILMRWSTS